MAKRQLTKHWIDPSALDKRTKQQLWAGLKALEPDLADMIKNDPTLTELKNSFSATVRFSRDKAAEYVREGRRLLEEKQNNEHRKPID